MKVSFVNRFVTTYLAILFGILIHPLALAQDNEKAQAGVLEEVTVVAERRESNQQSIPIAINTISGQQLNNIGVARIDELSVGVPNLLMTVSRGALAVFLRGVGTQNVGLGEEGATAIYVDDVYINDLEGGLDGFNNIERVEVLKGPQGTLFGRNATAGLIHIITKTPSHEPFAQLQVGYGNYDTYRANAYATTGVTDTLAVDFAANMTDQQEGWGRRLTFGDHMANYLREHIFRSKALWTPTDRLTANISADYTFRRSDVGADYGLFPGTIAIGGTPAASSIYDSLSGDSELPHFQQWGISAEEVYDFDAIKFKSISAYRDTRSLWPSFDQDGTPLRVVDALLKDRAQSEQQEFLLLGDAGRLQWTTGVFLLNRSAYSEPLTIRSSVSAALNYSQYSTTRTRSASAYAQGKYGFTDDKTALTLGVRETYDKKEIAGYKELLAPNPGGAPGTIVSPGQQEASWTEPTYRIALEHNFTPDIMGYVAYNRGFKSGVYNITNYLQAAVNPEILNAATVGVKSELFDRTLRLNAEAFHYNYKNMQVAVASAGFNTIMSVEGSRIYGLDLDFVYLTPIRTGSLQFSGGVGLLHSRYLNLPNATILIPNPAGGNIQTVGDETGKQLARAPDLTSSISADYSIDTRVGELAFNLTEAYNGGFYWDIQNRLRQSSYSLVNMTITLNPVNAPWSVSVFAKNLTSSQYVTSVISGTLGDPIVPGAPRTYGVWFGYKWGKGK